MPHRILLISYTFPPYPGIGGRRWAKFAYQLAIKGNKIHVIAAKNPYKEISQWTKDVQHPNIIAHPLPIKYPRMLLHSTNSLYGKIAYKLWKLFLSFYSKGVIIERTIFWKKQLLKSAEDIIKNEKIDNIIITIPPYRLAYYGHFIKKKFPSVNLILDYRDPWTDNKSFHGFANISSERIRHEQKIEMQALIAANHIVTVSNIMSQNIKKRISFPEKVTTIYNGFDPREINAGEISEPVTGKYHFIYAGTLYSNLGYIIDPLILYMQNFKQKNITLYNNIYIEFFGKHNQDIENKIIKLNDSHIAAYKHISLPEVQKKMSNATFGVLMSAPDHAFAFNTKFFEYLANKKPILLFSPSGETSEFITGNKLGYHINPSSIEKDMDDFLINMDSIIEKFNTEFDISYFSIPALTSKFEKLLK